MMCSGMSSPVRGFYWPDHNRIQNKIYLLLHQKAISYFGEWMIIGTTGDGDGDAGIRGLVAGGYRWCWSLKEKY